MFNFSNKTDTQEKALRTIGEVSDAIGVPDYVIRFWEKKFSDFQPVKRNNIRYYRPGDIKVLNLIKELLYKKGYTIKGVQKILKNEIKKLADNDKAENEEEQNLTQENQITENQLTENDMENIREASNILKKAEQILSS